MSNYFDIEARFFSRATGLRLEVNPDDILQVAWEEVEAGGTGQITTELARPYDDLNWPVQGGDTIEVWALGTGETTPRCRGAVGQYEKVLDLKERFLLTSYGRMEDMNRVVLDRILLHPGGADLSVFVGQIADDYAARRPGLAFVRDIQFVNVSLEQLAQTNATARASMDQIAAQAGGNVVWGWDIDPASGLDRFYLRPKTDTIGEQFFVGASVKMMSAPSELQNLVNGIKLQGGPAKYPQLLTNPSLEVPTLPGEAGGNLLTDGGFEFGIAWHYGGGASRVSQHDISAHNTTAHTGNYYALLDHAGEEIWQECAATQGKTYRASLFDSRESGSFASQGTLIIEGRSASGAVLETYSLPLAPASTAWTGGQGSTVLASDATQLSVTFGSPATTTARVRVVSSNGSNTNGLCIDDVTFADAASVGQVGWFANARDGKTIGSQFATLDWACGGAAWEGAYGLRARVTPTSQWNPAIEPYPGLDGHNQGFHFKPAPQQALRVGVRVRMAPGLATGAGQVRAEYVEWAGDGHQTQRINGPGVTIPNDALWHFVYQDVSAHGDAASATVGLTFGTGGVYDVDGWTARDRQAGEGADPADPLGVQTFLRGTNFEIYVTAEQVCPVGSDAYNSFAIYGRQEAVVSNDQIVDWNADAKQWAAAYLGRVAVPLVRPQVQLDHEPARRPNPGQGTQVRISGTATDLTDWCAKTRYAWAKLLLGVTLEMSSDRPTWAKLLLGINSGGGGGSASSIAAVAKGGGGGSTTTPAPAYFGTIPHTSADATLHDAYFAAPHVPPATGDGQTLRWNAATSAYVADPLAVNNGTGTLTLTALGGSNTGLTLVNQGTTGNDFPAIAIGSHDAYSTIYVTNHGHPLGCITGYYTVASDGYRFLGADGTAIFSGWQNGNCTAKGLFQAGGYAASDGTAGVTGTGGGGDTIKNGLVTALGTPSASVTLSQAVPSAETAGTAGSVGTATTAARADHVHAMPAAYPPTAHAGSHGAGGSDPVSPASIGAESTANKGAANGYAGLDASGKIPTNALPASVVGGMVYQGAWDANANSPALASGTGTKGAYYKISVAGSTTLDGNNGWHVGDWVAFDGATWDKIDNFEAVTSVAGRVGAVTLATADIAGLGTAAVANVPAAGSNASSAQVVRGDDTRLGATTPLATTMPAAETAGAAGTVGTSTSAARADHVHPLPGPFAASGTGHAAGFVPDPGAAAGSARFLREDGGWQVPVLRQATVTLFYGGTLATGLSGLPYCVPPGVTLTVTGLRLRLGTAGTTTTSINIQKSTGGISAAFAAAATSQNLSTATATAPGGTTDAIAPAMTFNAGDLIDLNVVTAGTGAKDAQAELICTY